MTVKEGGFTVVEVLVAIVVLAIGIVALMGSSAMVTRMVGRGKTTTFAAQIATRRLERLRAIAASTATPCTSGNFTNGSRSAGLNDQGVTESWTVTAGPTTATRKVSVLVTYKVPGGSRTETITTLISCAS